MTLRSWIIILNAVAGLAIVVLLVALVLLRRKHIDAGPGLEPLSPDVPAIPEDRTPPNIATPPPDDTLEGRKLERVLGTALFFSVVIAAAMPIYWLLEPSREASATRGYDKQSAERGGVLFANKAMETYDATRSLLCADCHGADAGGGSKTFVLKSEDPNCELGSTEPECLPKQVVWKVPALNNVALRFPAGEGCKPADALDANKPNCYRQLKDIIIYGRPGTPMPAWGVASGKGTLNEQGIADLVSYLQSIQISTVDNQANSTKAIGETRKQAKEWLATAEQNVKDAQAALAEATTADEKTDAQTALDNANVALLNTTAFANDIEAANDGEILFLNNCARCHTKGWSYFDPTNPDVPLPAAQGSGALGPNLRDGDVLRQFPIPQDQLDFVTFGSKYQQGYGVRGIGTARMPAMDRTLTVKQIQRLVDYERTKLQEQQ